MSVAIRLSPWADVPGFIAAPHRDQGQLVSTEFGLLSIRDQQRFLLGVEHDLLLGTRMVMHRYADLARQGDGILQLLDKLDATRDGLPADQVGNLGCGHFTARRLRVVPR